MIYYVFLMKRQFDKAPWPVIWTNKDLAKQEPYRVSNITEVVLQPRLDTIHTETKT